MVIGFVMFKRMNYHKTKEVCFLKKEYYVAQDNQLVDARHKKPLTVREQKIILTMASMIEPSDEDFTEYVISIKEFYEMLGLRGDPHYTQLKEVVENLMTKTIEIPQEDGGWLLTHWVSTARYIPGKGAIRLKFVPELKPYFLQLKNQYTSYKLSNVLSLGSVYSIRLYELMRRSLYIGKREILVNELKLKFGIAGDSYKQYGHFKARVLTPAVKEVNKQTDLQVSFKEIKKGRSVERIEFIIQHAPEKEIKILEKLNKPEQPKKQSENEDIRKRLNALASDYSFNHIYFTEMYEGALFIWSDDAEKELSMLIRYVNEEEGVKNPLGFIKIKLQEYGELYQEGLPVTFADLKPSQRRTGRAEKIPEWFKNRSATNEVEKKIDSNIVEERQKLLNELGIKNDQ
ncbi:replication initiation protein [Sporosarcina sp. E16_3]|uniref:replication initiation protein n=1 Tax=Sporosarcina sp. E16_3 TaxID=2789293 RepID=UPI002105AAE0|nr:replication initiation protein [Sporosarcina sp. E16_3]